MEELSIQRVGQNPQQKVQKVERHRVEEVEGFESPEDIVREEATSSNIDVKA